MALRKMAVAAVVELKHRRTPPLMAMSRILHCDPSSGIRRFGTPALGRNLDHNNINGNDAGEDNLMLVVDRGNLQPYLTDYGLPNNLSVLSIENKSLESVQPNRPNFSRLNSSACYEYLGAGDRWMVMRTKDEGVTTPAALLWDPTTDEVRPLPQFQVKPRLPVESWWYPYEPHPLWGVGFDPCSGDYKVVRCPNFYDADRGPSEIKGELLSLGAGSWREIRFPHPTMNITQNGILINGFYYWLTYEDIIPFDFGREEFPADLIPLPEELIGQLSSPLTGHVLAEYHGSLAVIWSNVRLSSEDGKFEPTFWFKIWVWSNGDRSWSHLSTVHFPGDVDLSQALGLYNNDKVILRDFQATMLLYDCRTSELENFGIINDYQYFMIYPYYYSKSKRT